MPTKRAMVTGASSGIGEAFARDLARRGFSLVLVARRQGALAAIARELGADTESLALDLTEEDAVTQVINRLEAGDISVVVNNAGVGYRGLVAGQSDESITQLSRLNFETPMRLARAALGPMLASRSGAVINVVSMGAFQPVPYLNVYAATKAGLLSFTEALADEVSGRGVVIQALCPGNIPTGFQETAGTKGSRFDKTPSMSAETVARRSLDAALGGGPTTLIPATRDRVSVFAQRFLPRAAARRVAGSLLRP